MSERPSEMISTARVARMYYLEDRSKSDIAQELGISRFRVARLLDTARRAGVVNIEIRSPGSLDVELSLQLQSGWGLKHAVVLDVADEDHTQLRRQLGESAAHVLTEIVTAEDVLGIAWSRSASAVGDALQRFVPCPVVQLTGAISRPDGGDVLGLVRRLARLGGGSPNVFYAPMVVPDAATARLLRKQPEVVRAMSLVPKVTVAVVGVGAWSSGLSTIYDSVEQDDRDITARSGVVAEISGVFIDQLGAAVRPPLSRRGCTPQRTRQRADHPHRTRSTPRRAVSASSGKQRNDRRWVTRTAHCVAAQRIAVGSSASVTQCTDHVARRVQPCINCSIT